MEISSKALASYLKDDLQAAVACDFTVVRDYFPGATAREVAACRMWNSFLKKLSDEKSADADQRCLDKFNAANLRCRDWRYDPCLSRDEELFGELRATLDDFFHPGGEPLVRSYMDLAVRGRCGPGASLGAKGTDFYTKLFSSQLTSTSLYLYDMYSECAQWYPDWLDAEFHRLIQFGDVKLARSSSLSFVRKTRDISRSICTEPTLNMFFQLGLGEILASRLKSLWGIDLACQQLMNRDLARRGSVDDGIVTIDLESASDNISLNLVSSVFPEWVSSLLRELRTPNVRLGVEQVPLYMVSTMGNGFTFPLQTILFAAIVVAATRCNSLSLGRCDAALPAWGVFGDDIICPSGKVGRDVLRLLRLCGAQVNGDKSYLTGPFRESCGKDFYQGVDVRGVYLKTLLTRQSRYVAINRLNEWSARTGISLPRTVGYLVDSVPVLAIPAFESIDAGIRTPRPPLGLWKSAKQRYHYRCRAPHMPLLKVGEELITYDGPVSNNRFQRYFNPPGLLFSFVGGYVRNGKIPLALKQGEDPSYRTVDRVAPFWGPDRHQLASQSAEFWARWNTAVDENMYSLTE